MSQPMSDRCEAQVNVSREVSGHGFGFGTHNCELEKGHIGFHRIGQVTWCAKPFHELANLGAANPSPVTPDGGAAVATCACGGNWGLGYDAHTKNWCGFINKVGDILEALEAREARALLADLAACLPKEDKCETAEPNTTGVNGTESV